jgi:hypothetical protein
MQRRSALSLVIPEEPPKLSLSPADALAEIVPELLAAEREVVRLRRLVDEQRAKLARARGVAFIREEHVRREFGGG